MLLALACTLLFAPAPATAATADAYEPDDSSAAATPITVDAAAQQHTIFPAGDQDWVSFSVEVGRTYTIETTSGTPAENMDTVLYLYDADGTTEIGYDDDGGTGSYSLIEYVADANKTVYAKVVDYHGYTTGAYALGVSSVSTPVGDAYEPDDSAAAASPITVDAAAQQHTIFPAGDQDWVSFTVTAGQTYTIETAPGDPFYTDTVLYLYDTNGTTLIDSNNNGGTDPSGYYSRIVYPAEADKTVYAKVTAPDSVGAYALGVSAANTLVADSYEPDGSFSAAKPLTVDAAAQQRSIAPEGDQDWVSFAVTAGWKYTVQTGPGTPVQDFDHVLALYDADGTTQIAVSGEYDEGGFELIEYAADADKTVYAKVVGFSGWYSHTGTYALSVTRTPSMKIGVVPTSIDFGEVAVGASLRRTVVVENQGVAPFDVGSVQLTGAGFSIVRDEASGDPIPVGESREIEVAYAPTVACTGPPSAVKHSWTNVLVLYRYSNGVLIGYWLYSGFQNTGGAGALGWRVKIGAQETTGSGAVVAGGRYTVRMAVSNGSSSALVELLEPVSAAYDFTKSLGGLQGVEYRRVPDATLSIASNDDDEPTIDVDLLGVAVPGGPPDTTPPTTTDDADGLWHNSPVTVNLTAVDNVGGSGMSGGAAKTEYKVDGAAAWTTGTSVLIGAPADHSNDGAHTVSYRSTDRAGNVEAPKSCTVRIDTTAPTGSFALAGDAATTTSTAVTATLAITEPNGPMQMRFSTDAKSSWSAWTAYAATAPVTLPDGLGPKTAWAQVRDAAGNVLELADDIELVEGPPDTTRPTIEALGAAEGAWYRSAVTVTLVGSDDEGGSGVASITYNLDGIETTVAGASASVSVPVLPNAPHTLVFHATDHATNPSLEQTLHFTCDSTGPVTAGKAASGRVNRAVYLYYKVSDNLSPKAKAIKIVVKNSRGKTVKTFLPAAKNTATWYRAKWVPKAKGTYRYYVYAKDLAGNGQRIRGSAKVVVK